MNKKIAVILFPGSNCEEEAKFVVEAIGMDSEIIRWNEPTEKLESFDGYIIPGGWSYEDRIRGGVIAAKSSIIKFLKKADKENKPILGICNGCQVLVESGIVPNLEIENVEMGMAPNINPKVTGFYCTWTNLIKENDCAFTDGINDKEILPMPIAHGEGRFVTNNQEVIDELVKNNQIIFKYCDSQGNVKDSFPTNPNGTTLNIAGISNKKGNALALMPHPERASFNRQMKFQPLKSFEDGESHAPSIKIFKSMKTFLEGEKNE